MSGSEPDTPLTPRSSDAVEQVLAALVADAEAFAEGDAGGQSWTEGPNPAAVSRSDQLQQLLPESEGDEERSAALEPKQDGVTPAGSTLQQPTLQEEQQQSIVQEQEAPELKQEKQQQEVEQDVLTQEEHQTMFHIHSLSPQPLQRPPPRC